MRGFVIQLYEAFRRVNGYAIGGIGFLASMAAYIWLPSGTVSARVLVPVGFVLILLVTTLIDCAYQCCSRYMNPLPRVLRSLPPSRLYPDSVAVLLAESSALLSYGSIVSLYTRDKDCEILIGYGSVLTVQTNGLIQISAEDVVDGKSSEIWSRIIQNNVDEIAALAVKPSIPAHLIQR